MYGWNYQWNITMEYLYGITQCLYSICLHFVQSSRIFKILFSSASRLCALYSYSLSSARGPGLLCQGLVSECVQKGVISAYFFAIQFAKSNLYF